MPKFVIIGFFLFLSFQGYSQCASCNQAESGAVWEGDVDSDWEDANNWLGNTLPTGGAITIDGDLYTNAPVISVSSSFSPADVFIQDGATLTLQADLSLTDDFIIRNNSSLIIQGGSNATGDDINLCAGGSIVMSGGTLDNTSGSGILRVCTTEPAAATGTTEIIITGGTITNTTSDPETGVIDDFITTSGEGTYTDGSIVLPVELLAFGGKIESNSIKLTWSTASELNNQQFEVQRSWDGHDFTTIGLVAGNGTTNEVKQYELEDSNPWKTSYYRLKQMDFDGNTELHEVIRVEHSLGAEPYSISYHHARSTPIKIQSAFPIEEVQLINGAGQIIYSSSTDAGLEIPTNDLSIGIYFLQLQWNSTVVRKKILFVE